MDATYEFPVLYNHGSLEPGGAQVIELPPCINDELSLSELFRPAGLGTTSSVLASATPTCLKGK